MRIRPFPKLPSFRSSAKWTPPFAVRRSEVGYPDDPPPRLGPSPVISRGNFGHLFRACKEVLDKKIDSEKAACRRVFRHELGVLNEGRGLDSVQGWWPSLATRAIRTQLDTWQSDPSQIGDRKRGFLSPEVASDSLYDLLEYFGTSGLSGLRILDLGCRHAPLLQVLLDSRVAFKSYVGVDLSERMAKSTMTAVVAAHPSEKRVRIVHGDWFTQTARSDDEGVLGETFDIVFGANIFALRPASIAAADFNGAMLAVINRFVQRASHGFIFNFLPKVPDGEESAVTSETKFEGTEAHFVERMRLAISLDSLGLDVHANPARYFDLTRPTSFMVLKPTEAPKKKAVKK